MFILGGISNEAQKRFDVDGLLQAQMRLGIVSISCTVSNAVNFTGTQHV